MVKTILWNVALKCTPTIQQLLVMLKKKCQSVLYIHDRQALIWRKNWKNIKLKSTREKRKTNVIFDPRERNEWKYIYDSCRGNLYRFRYLNQEETASVFLSRKGHPILGEILSRNGEADLAFYSSRIKNEYDIENLPGHKDIWKILSVANISKIKWG